MIKAAYAEFSRHFARIFAGLRSVIWLVLRCVFPSGVSQIICLLEVATHNLYSIKDLSIVICSTCIPIAGIIA